MDFTYSEEQQMLQESVQKFVARSYDFDSRKKILAEPRGYSEDNWRLFAELGWLTVPFAEADGGFGGRAVDLMVVMEEFGRAMVVEPFVPTAVLSGHLLAALGSDADKADLLPRVMGGELQLACAFSETLSRYTLATVGTQAVATSGGLTVSGEKISVLNGAQADELLVVVRESGAVTDPDGISVLRIPGDAPGVHRLGYVNVDGHPAARIRLENVVVDAERRLGAAGAALPALTAAVDFATLAVAAEAVGALDTLLRKTVEYSRTRQQFGTPIGTFQALQHRMADMFIECQLARSIVMMAAMTWDGTGSDAAKSKAVSAAKSRVGKAIRTVGQEAVQLHGGIGITHELDVAHLFKRVTAIESLFGNTDHHTARFAAL